MDVKKYFKFVDEKKYLQIFSLSDDCESDPKSMIKSLENYKYKIYYSIRDKIQWA